MSRTPCNGSICCCGMRTPAAGEVEVQLAPTDESHIVRTIEYSDIERERYPQYEYYAALVAEE